MQQHEHEQCEHLALARHERGQRAAQPDRLRGEIGPADGISRWWSGRPVDGADEITWRAEEGPDSWVDTLVTFTLRSDSDERTTLLFSHAGRCEASEFMSGRCTNWGVYLTSLRHGVEGGAVARFPNSEISRWS